VNYEQFGVFSGRGTSKYKYKIVDVEGLAKAAGAGIFPNSSAIKRDPNFKKWLTKASADRVPWNHVNTGDPQSDFYVWATAEGVGPGTQLFFTGEALLNAGHYEQALKAYYASLVHFPGEAVWSADLTFVWYIGPAALNRIEEITNHHPELGFKLAGAFCKIENAEDTNLKNDIVTVDPGHWEKVQPAKLGLEGLKIIRERGKGRVRLVQYENRHWQLIVDGAPLVVHGVSYMPTPIGLHISEYGNKWMYEDRNHNGKPDAPYDAFVDRNKNGKKDRDEKPVGDFQLMKDMGVNAIRIYRMSTDLKYDSREFNKKLLRDLYKTYGIRVVMGDYLGAYTVGSGASYEAGTDYTDPVQKKHMKNLVAAYVNDHKKEPYVLMWLLGNENLMSADYSGVNATRTLASKQPEAYLKFVNEVAGMIHSLDPDHPVAVGNWEKGFLEEHAKYAPAVDIMGVNSYQGKVGFGRLWKDVREKFDRPVLITEYGVDAFDWRTGEEDEKVQAEYHEGNWKDIEYHLAGGAGEGNSIGGIIFEWLDEWWKSNLGSWNVHEKTKDQPMAFPDGFSSEEWFGLFSAGDGEESPFYRSPRQVYFLYKDKLWRK